MSLFIDDFTADHYINAAGSSGAVINTSAGQLELSSGGIYLTEAIHIDNTLITQITPEWEVGSGTFKVEARTEGNIWRELTSGSTLFFSEGETTGGMLTSFPYVFPMVFTGPGDERGVELYLRITETAASTATVKKIKVKING